MAEFAILRDLAPVGAQSKSLGQRKSWGPSTWRGTPFDFEVKSIDEEVQSARVRGSRPLPAVEVHDVDSKQLNEIASDPGTKGIAPLIPTVLIKPFAAEGALTASDSWGIAAIEADKSNCTGQGVVVAVLDTGIDNAHPAFDGIEIMEEDFTGSGNGDRQGHGTHCAGTVFGRDIDGRRIGIARGVERVLIGKVLGDDGGGDSGAIWRGIQWAVNEGAQVISMSLGFDFPGLVRRMQDSGWPVELATSTALEGYRGNLRMLDALMRMVKAQEAFGRGTVVVAATGNESRVDRDPRFKIAASLPAAAEGIISVGALGQAGPELRVAPFSNIFPQVSAPGVGIVSAKAGGGLRALSGTSMACPHVAGAAALWWQRVKEDGGVTANATNVIDRIRTTARTNVFAAGVGPDERGTGVVTAPQ